jgi:hypothetical protein
MMMKKADQQGMALKLRSSVKEYLYCNSSLRNDFQVRPVVAGEIKVFEDVKYARVSNNGGPGSTEFKNQNVVVPFFELGCVHFDDQFIDDKGQRSEPLYHGFNRAFCENMLIEEERVYKSLKKFFTKSRKGILLILSDIEVLCSNKRKTLGFSAFEQIGGWKSFGERL